MSFGFVPALLGVFGLLAIAAALFALQRLRVRHQQVEVETTLFWKQAIEESRARVLTQRFRHPWTYALLLLICALLWLSFAGIRGDGGDGRRHLVLLDGSAGMAHGERFARAIERAQDYVAGLPQERRTVVLCAGRTETLLRPGEPALLLSRRLDGVAPAAAPNRIAEVLFDLVRAADGVPTTVCVVGDAPLRAAERALLPDSVRLRRLPVPPRSGANAGITALGVRPAASGRWDAVDVLVEVLVASGATDGAAPRLRLDDVDWTGTPSAEPVDGGRRFRYRDVPANGQQLTASLAGGDALALDDVATFALPDRTPIPVAIGPGVPAIVLRAVASDPGLVRRDGDARVVVRVAGTTFGSGLPAFELADPEQSDDAFLVFHPPGQDPSAVLDELYTGLGLHEIDAMAAAAALGRAVTMGAKPAERKGLWVWRQLLDPDYDFVRSRSFPLFVGLGLRWLADFEEGPAWVAVGEPVAAHDGDVTASEVRGRSFGAAFVPRQPGRHQPARGAAFAASLLDPHASGLAAVDLADIDELDAASSSGFDLITVLLLFALLLLAAEWVLFRTSRIP
jgi:hypothetical protein